MAALETPNPDRLRPPNPTGSSGRSVCGLKVVCQTVGLLATLQSLLKGIVRARSIFRIFVSVVIVPSVNATSLNLSIFHE
jgi:hypothetical protein